MSVTQSKRPRGKAELTRAAILEAARPAFETCSFAEARTPEIADAAGVAEGTLFLHFGSKLGLLAAVMEQFYRNELLEPGRRIVAAHADPRARLEALLGDFVRKLRDHWRLVRGFGPRGRQDDNALHEAFKRLNRDFTRPYLDCLRELQAAGRLRPEVDVIILRDALLGGVELYVTGQIDAGRTVDAERCVAQLLGMALQGAEPSAAPSRADLARLEAKIDALASDGVARRSPPR